MPSNSGTKKRKKATETVSSLKKKCDSAFSRLIRFRNKDRMGCVRCITCGKWKPFNEMQAGHFVSRGKNALRYDERNVHPQCYSCNIPLKGNYPRYCEYLIRKYGSDIIEILNREGEEIKQYKVYDLKFLLAEFKKELKKYG